jgi:hypothetical protein
MMLALSAEMQHAELCGTVERGRRRRTGNVHAELQMSNFARAKAKFEADKMAAYRTAAENLTPVLPVNFHITGWSNKAREAVIDQWNRKPDDWDWSEIFRRHNDPDRLDMAIWSPDDRLSALSLCLTNSNYVEIRFLEGDPRDDCPLRGRRALIVVECAACYAQARGRPELRLEPNNERLATLYRQIYGFELATPRKAKAYYFKKV